VKVALFRRLLIVIAFVALLNFYADQSLLRRWADADQHVGAEWAAGVLFFLLQMTGPFGDRLGFARWKRKPVTRALVKALDWSSYLAFGTFSCLVFYGLAGDIVTVLYQLVTHSASPALNFYSLLGIAGMTAGTICIGVAQVWRGPKLKHVDVPLTGLPQAFDGFRIVQISDLHVGPTIGRRTVDNVVRMANGAQPDLIALTGDFADGKVDDLKEEMAMLSSLRAPLGMYFITGNHEYYWGAKAWEKEWARLGAHVLSNAHDVLKKDGSAIILAGVTDYSTSGMPPDERSDPARALAGAPEGLVKILLAHQPASYRAAEEAGFSLQLSGHTHGGQYFPFSLLIRFFQTYYKGLNRYKNLWIYVSVGTGYWGPPLRTFVPAEVTLITLRSA
jgi:predicted MPP superfamily phosphohydrolase